MFVVNKTGPFCLSLLQMFSYNDRFRHVTGVRAAFAKAVSNAMVKPVKRLCGEIAQDHADALAGNLHGQDTET